MAKPEAHDNGKTTVNGRILRLYHLPQLRAALLLRCLLQLLLLPLAPSLQVVHVHVRRLLLLVAPVVLGVPDVQEKVKKDAGKEWARGAAVSACKRYQD